MTVGKSEKDGPDSSGGTPGLLTAGLCSDAEGLCGKIFDMVSFNVCCCGIIGAVFTAVELVSVFSEGITTSSSSCSVTSKPFFFFSLIRMTFATRSARICDLGKVLALSMNECAKQSVAEGLVSGFLSKHDITNSTNSFEKFFGFEKPKSNSVINLYLTLQSTSMLA